MSAIQVSFTKGHGTQNDFVVIPNADGSLQLTPEQVAWLCHRHAGVGADGIIVVTPSQFSDIPQVKAMADRAGWFMDYRNADGTVAEMCGNGTRVFAEYLCAQGWETGTSFEIATRAGIKQLRRHEHGWAVNLGQWQPHHPGQERVARTVRYPDAEWPGEDFSLGNPHTVCFVEDEGALAELDLLTPPQVSPVPEHGTNVEWISRTGESSIRMRVYERGVGETRSCGTGAAAAALAAAARWGGQPDASWQVDVLGGSVWVTPLPDGTVELAGPAQLVARGTAAVPCVN